MDIFVGNDGKNELYFSAGDGSGGFAAAPADCAATTGSSDTRSAAIADLNQVFPLLAATCIMRFSRPADICSYPFN